MNTYTLNGENVSFTGQTRNQGHGWQVEVQYGDGSTGWEHFQDILGDNGQFFEFMSGDEEKDDSWDYDGSNDTYETLVDAIDRWKVIQSETL